MKMLYCRYQQLRKDADSSKVTSNLTAFPFPKRKNNSQLLTASWYIGGIFSFSHSTSFLLKRTKL
uniref:Uncharacterized protein n=1 Tax=Ascaris lumbricoides TaxID=6252 RepID=A0A9J2PUG4_ASCLU